MQFVGKQAELVHLGRRPERYIVAHGAVRSGKTVAGLTGFLCWSGRAFRGHNFLLSSHTMSQVRANLIPHATRISVGADVDVKVRLQEKRMIIGENSYYLYEGLDAQSAPKIQGLTLAGAFLDEAALMPQAFVAEVISRCSVPGAKVVMNCNPEGPHHWLRQDFILAGESAGVHDIPFRLADNPHLDPAYIRSLETSLTGVFYRRRVLGEWAAATGRVYEGWIVEPCPRDPPWDLQVAVDAGIATVTHATLFGQYRSAPRRLYAIAEYRWDARERGQKPESYHAEQIKLMCGGHTPSRVVADPNARQLKAELHQHWPGLIVDADNDVSDGIQLTSAWLSNGTVIIDPICVGTLMEMDSYTWDERAAERGESKPAKVNDHAMDALRYMCLTESKSKRRRIRGHQSAES